MTQESWKETLVALDEENAEADEQHRLFLAALPPIALDGLWDFSKQLIDAFPNTFLKADPHDPDDPEGADLLWLELTPESEHKLSDGELIMVSPFCRDHSVWDISRDSAYRFGGWPTDWMKYGTADELIAFLKERGIPRDAREGGNG